VVAIHDAVRPFTSKEFLNKAFELAEIYNSAIPVIEISDSLRMMKNGTLQSIDRNLIKAVQTPQVFNNQMIHQAYSSVSDSKYITDDSTVFERSGRSLHFFEGENQNIKITTPFDLIVAETILLQKSLTQGS
jgi:2-C-methyl-D-erythritol 4-phosphate cytidylyltransferase